MKKNNYGNGLYNDFDEALAENAIAKSRYESLPPADREQFLQRAEKVRSLEEMKALLDELVGWQEGHGPYQC